MRDGLFSLLLLAACPFAGSQNTYDYSMICEATQPCILPIAEGQTTDGAPAVVGAKVFTIEKEVNGNYAVVHTVQKATAAEAIADIPDRNTATNAFDKPAIYLIKYKAGEDPNSEEVTVMVQVKDTVAPSITMCGSKSRRVMMLDSWTPCAVTAATDTVDNDVSATLTATITGDDSTNFNTTAFTPGNPAAEEAVFVKVMKTAAKYTLTYEARDTSGNVGRAVRDIFVVDEKKPVVTVQGAENDLVECGDSYVEAGATAHDESVHGGITTFTADRYGGSRRSCLEIKESYLDAKSGYYDIQSPGVNNGQPLRVWCDMDSDGGGYTYYALDGTGIPVKSIKEADSCTALGLQMAVFRTQAQVNKLITQFTPAYFKVAGGIVGSPKAVSTDLSMVSPLSSASSIANGAWYANDHGSWFLTSEVDPDFTGTSYKPGCYISIVGINPLDYNPDQGSGAGCIHSTGTSYVCSTNDKDPGRVNRAKGISGVLPLQEKGLAPNFPDTKKVGRYGISYRAKDTHGNWGKAKRTVEVRDTMGPKIHMQGMGIVFQHAVSGADAANFILHDPGVKCEDVCDGTLLAQNGSITVSWVPPDQCGGQCSGDIDPSKVGRYVRKYECKDLAENTATSVTRTFEIINDQVPVLAVQGSNPITVEAKLGGRYEDVGATCIDMAGNVINQQVTASGETVNLERVGTYMVKYGCWDKARNKDAIEATRQVIVRDTTCPNIKLKGTHVVIMEAGFEWRDPGVDAEDNIDGTINSRVTVDGDTVDVSKAYYSRGSCLEILTEARAEGRQLHSGYYQITVAIEQPGSNERLGSYTHKYKKVRVYCDMVTDGGGYTVYKVTNGLRTSKHSDPNSCQAIGMQMVVPRSEGHYRKMLAEFGREYFNIVPGIYGNRTAASAGGWADPSVHTMMSNYWSKPAAGEPAVAGTWKAVDGGDWFIRNSPFAAAFDSSKNTAYTPGCWLSMFHWQSGDYHFEANGCAYSSTNYLCSTNDKGGPGTGVSHSNKRVNAYPSGAEEGKYVISYHVTDNAGNKECKTIYRTVLVKDTLPPVIRVDIGGTRVIDGKLVDARGNELSGSGMAVAMHHLFAVVGVAGADPWWAWAGLSAAAAVSGLVLAHQARPAASSGAYHFEAADL